MKKAMLTSLALLAGVAQANELTTFDEVAGAVAKGQQIKFVIDTRQCTSTIFMPPVDAVITPNTVVVVNNAKITASVRHFTLDSPTAPGLPVYDYMKYNISADGNAVMKMTNMNAHTYEEIYSFQISCQLGKGFKVFGH